MAPSRRFRATARACRQPELPLKRRDLALKNARPLAGRAASRPEQPLRPETVVR
jgi:hypothetical protein